MSSNIADMIDYSFEVNILAAPSLHPWSSSVVETQIPLSSVNNDVQ